MLTLQFGAVGEVKPVWKSFTKSVCLLLLATGLMRASDTKSQVRETKTILKKEQKSPPPKKKERSIGNESFEAFALALLAAPFCAEIHFFVAALIKAFKWQSNRGL